MFSGGGKDLATAAGIANIKEEKPTDRPASPLAKTQGALNGKSHIIFKTTQIFSLLMVFSHKSVFYKLFLALNQKFGNKIPGGLVTKNAAPGYEMVRVGGSQGAPPSFVNANQLNQLNQLAAGYGFPPGLATLAGFNPAFLQPSKSTFIKVSFSVSSLILRKLKFSSSLAFKQ